jgi:hypothetical protein
MAFARCSASFCGSLRADGPGGEAAIIDLLFAIASIPTLESAPQLPTSEIDKWRPTGKAAALETQ